MDLFKLPRINRVLFLSRIIDKAVHDRVNACMYLACPKQHVYNVNFSLIRNSLVISLRKRQCRTVSVIRHI